jgi:hypothetical protein
MHVFMVIDSRCDQGWNQQRAQTERPARMDSDRALNDDFIGHLRGGCE